MLKLSTSPAKALDPGLSLDGHRNCVGQINCIVRPGDPRAQNVEKNPSA